MSPLTTDSYLTFWSLKFAAGSHLAQFANTLGHAAITEAAVERSFSAQVQTIVPCLPAVAICHRLECIASSETICRRGYVRHNPRCGPREGGCYRWKMMCYAVPPTWLLLNHCKLVHPDQASADVAKRQEERKKKRAKAEEGFAALVQKRMRP